MCTNQALKRCRSISRSPPDSQPPRNRQKTFAKPCQDHVTSSTTPDCLMMLSKTEHKERNYNEVDVANQRVGEAMRGRWVGPMDPALFLERFLPSIDGYSTHDILQKRYIVSSINTSTQELLNIGSESTSDQVPMDTEIMERLQMNPPLALNYQENEDPFSDSGEGYDTPEENAFPFERDGDKYRMIQGQIASSLSAFAEDYFLLHCFAVLSFGKYSRILRWDRNGVIATKKFGHSAEDHLAEFLWQFSHTTLDDPIRGCDPTVQPSPPGKHYQTPQEEAARTKLVEANKDNHRQFRIILVPDRDRTDKEYPFLISYPPKSKSHSPFGRATKPMLAFDIDKNIMVFLKDYWRTVSDNTDKEGDIYTILQEKGVPNIPAFGRGNDVRDHVTLTDVIKTEDWALPTAPMEPLRHYRMSLDEIGRPSNTFKSSHELVTAVADAMEAHEAAFHDANILHRDISAGNILITDGGRGLLIDWDLCLNMNKSKEKSGERGKIGTWAFLSCLLLKDPRHVQGIIDDQESSLYVLLWSMLRYTPHNHVDQQSDEMALFNEVSESNEGGGTRKELFLLSRYRDIVFRDRPHLNNLIRELSTILSIRYRKISAYERRMLDTEEAAIELPLNYVICERRITQRSWLVKTLRKHLEPRLEWPSADKASKNPDTSLPLPDYKYIP